MPVEFYLWVSHSVIPAWVPLNQQVLSFLALMLKQLQLQQLAVRQTNTPNITHHIPQSHLWSPILACQQKPI